MKQIFLLSLVFLDWVPRHCRLKLCVECGYRFYDNCHDETFLKTPNLCVLWLAKLFVKSFLWALPTVRCWKSTPFHKLKATEQLNFQQNVVPANTIDVLEFSREIYWKLVRTRWVGGLATTLPLWIFVYGAMLKETITAVKRLKKQRI